MPQELVHAQVALAITVDDGGVPVVGLREALEADWLCRTSARSVRPELAVQVIRHLEPFGRTYRWLSIGLPHLLIRFTDDAVHIGPLVSATGAPCHCCEALALVDAQPHLPMINAARYGKVPRSETVPIGILAGSIAAHIVRLWKAGSTEVHTLQVVVPVQHGLVSAMPTRTTVAPHPECGCALEHAAI